MADGSRDYILPTIQGKHSDLKTISSETVLKSSFSSEFKFNISCRACFFLYIYMYMFMQIKRLFKLQTSYHCVVPHTGCMRTISV